MKPEQDIEKLQKAAEQGDADAQYNLSIRCFHGNGVNQNYEKSIYWASKATEQGYADAEEWLWELYLLGDEKLFNITTKHAEQGDSWSQYRLGHIYKYGTGLEKDYEKTLYWFTKAAEQGNTDAQYNLGKMYYFGEDVESDYEKAFYWFSKAAEQENDVSQFFLGYMYYIGEGVESDYEKAFYWYLKAAEQGNASAQNNLGFMYEKGEYVKQDYEKAFYWYLKAAEQGLAQSQNRLGFLYEYGYGIIKDYKKAIYWYTKAAEQDFAQAQDSLGYLYEYGIGVTQDYKKAFYWYSKAAEQGVTSAQFKLGIMYFSGNGTKKDNSMAFQYWQETADKNVATAILLLSCMYKNGDGVEKDEQKAKELWNQIKNVLSSVTINHYIELYYKYRDGNNTNKEDSSMLETATNSDNLYCIKDVAIVSGKSLCPYWRSNMQLVSTDKGQYIDNLPGISHGSTPPGHDWKKEIGKKVDAVVSKDSKTDNTWIFIRQEYEKYNKLVPVSQKEELPPDYDINDNPELVKAYEAIKQNIPVIFLTGGAGTGKSTFIKFLKNNLKVDMNKNYVVLAPTGVAAINVGGQTIHSFFGWKEDVPDDKDVVKGLNKNPVIDYIDLIIIDEISMVPSWVIDNIDKALRFKCDNNKPFGGKQLLLIGDCFQLPHVVENKNLEKKKYCSQWDSPFFFAADSLKKLSNIKAFQLKKIYRQENDQRFINILNRIRECKNGFEKDVEYLNENCLIETRLGTKNVPSESLLLCTTNAKADEFNNKKLLNLVNKGNRSITYKAFIQGDFHYDNKRFLTKDTLDICVGAKIMVTKNLNSEHLVNGDMGIVLDFGGTGNSPNDYVDIEVKGTEYHLTRQTWEKQKYEWNNTTKTISQKVVGTFNQIPLTLGWAVTIHKSQGLTLDSVAIDAPDAWDSGQIYVALSRAKTLDGVLLCQKIPVSAVKVSEYVLEKYGELFQQDDNKNVENITNDYTKDLSNEGFTIDKSEEQTSVMIGGIKFELYPKGLEKIGNFAQRTIATLLVHNLIPEQEMQRLLKDENYSYCTFGIHFKFPTWTLKVPLLTKDRIHNENKVRYWATMYNGYYICSQWYPACKPKLAKWLINLSKGKLSGYVVAEDDSYNDESINWAKKKQEEKEKNFAAYFKQQREMEEERMFWEALGIKISSTPVPLKKEKKKDLPIIVRRNSKFDSTYYQFDSVDGSKSYFARKDGMENPEPPEIDSKIELIILQSEANKITKWEWDGL